MSSLANALQDVPEEAKETARVIKVVKPEPIEVTPARRFKWIGKATKAADLDKLTVAGSGGDKRKIRPSTEMGTRDHHFQQHSTMRLGRCELCQDKMWGLQEVKCACELASKEQCADIFSVRYCLSCQVCRQAAEVVLWQGGQERGERGAIA